jgi:hypothetical protein
VTAFIHTHVEVLPGVALVLDGNSKITAGNGTYAAPVPNAFSLPAASVSGRAHCPGSTPSCRGSCYVRGLATAAPDVYAAYTANARALDLILSGPLHDQAEAAHVLGEWIAEHAPAGFRWHVSGDVRDVSHARWIVQVCEASHRVRHWIYTRTLEAVAMLSWAGNLAVNVSADVHNFDAAADVARKHGARVAFMATAGANVPWLPAGSVIFPDSPLRGRSLPIATEAPWWVELPHRERAMVCPADFFGQSEAHRCGPCTKCLAR